MSTQVYVVFVSFFSSVYMIYIMSHFSAYRIVFLQNRFLAQFEGNSLIIIEYPK